MNQWQPICDVSQVVPDRGVAVLLGAATQQQQMVALFRLPSVGRRHPEQWFAVNHNDPIAGAPVMARGLVGSVGGTATVASPIDKRRYDLRTGLAIDGESPSLRSWPVRIIGGRVEICIAADARHKDAMA